MRTVAFALAALGVLPLIAETEVPSLEAYRRMWDEVRPDIAAGTERNRKASARLDFTGPDGKPLTNAAVSVRQRSHAFLFGCNALVLGQMGEREQAYESEFLKLFNLATTTFCFGAVEERRGEVRFEEGSREIWRRPPPDRVLAWCRRHGIKCKGQPLLAGSWHPKWAEGWSEADVRGLYRDWFRRVADRYGKSYAMFDVVNEAFLHRKFPLFEPKLEYVTWAFEEASRVFPKGCALTLNEMPGVNCTDTENTNSWCSQYANLLSRFRSRGIRLDGVGCQFHLFSHEELREVLEGRKWPPRDLMAVYGRYAEFGYPLYITEITVPSTLGGKTVGEAIQAEVAENYYRLWFSLPGFAGIAWWNLCDGAAYITDGGRRNEDLVKGALLDDNMREKPVYQALYRLIRREWTTSLEGTTDAAGGLDFRGFRGDYDITVLSDGATHHFTLSLTGEEPVRRTLSLPAVPRPVRPDLLRYTTMWEDVRPQIDAGIERHRKADAELVLMGADGKPLAAGSEVSVRLVRHAFDFGCNILNLGQMGEEEETYERAFTNLFNLATTTFCPNVINPARDDYRFEEGGGEVPRRPPPDRVVAFCERNGLRCKGQPLLCDHWHPDWARRHTRAEAEAYYRGWFRRVADRYGARVSMFDVVNEAFSCGQRSPSFPLYADEGLDYVDWAFAEAAKVFPDAVRLTINMGPEVNRWEEVPSDAWRQGCGRRYFDLVSRIREKGIRLDGAGFQFHVYSDAVPKILDCRWCTPGVLAKTYGAFERLDVPIYVSEVTLAAKPEKGYDYDGEAIQALMARNFYRFWFSRANMSGIIWWNLNDGRAWAREGESRGALLDGHLREKPAYQAIYQLVRREWTTDLDLKTDAEGKVRFRGFKGDYVARVRTADGVREFAFTMDGRKQPVLTEVETRR